MVVQGNLWEDVSNFDFDKPDSEYSFSTRLAKENFWTKNFTVRAISEYKKFMFLAATSDTMVSPSGIVDAVWHQHLVFSDSYTEFCNILGKFIRHVPSNRSKQDFQKFKLAKERTTKLYQERFGEQPKDIWNYDTMYDILDLPKASWKIRSVLVVGILLFVVSVVPFYFLLKPVYVKTDSDVFLSWYVAITLLTFAGLELYNAIRLSKKMKAFKENSFIKNLHPLELIYLKNQKLDEVVHCVVNGLINKNVIVVSSDNRLSVQKKDAKRFSVEENSVLLTLTDLGTPYYPSLLVQVRQKPIFQNFVNSTNAIKKFFTKSKEFAKLFYWNFGMLAVILMLGMIRLISGILMDKPSKWIFLLVIITLVAVAGYLWRVVNYICTSAIPKFYSEDIVPRKDMETRYLWESFFSGSLALAPIFAPLVNHVERNNGTSSGGDSSSCGSSCGSSCSSCGGCGGD
ncbi:MAG: glycine-rich domain-containing protein [Flammeovirgaceae bacterium]